MSGRAGIEALAGCALTALVWGGLRGQPNVWQVAGREDPLVLSGIVLGLAMGLLIVFTVTYAGPRIGVAATVGILIAGQLIMGAAIDRFGLFGSERIALHWPRVVGLVLLAAGAALSLRK